MLDEILTEAPNSMTYGYVARTTKFILIVLLSITVYGNVWRACKPNFDSTKLQRHKMKMKRKIEMEAIRSCEKRFTCFDQQSFIYFLRVHTYISSTEFSFLDFFRFHSFALVYF